MLRVLVAADMEGISGVVNWDQVTPGKPDYERFRRIMTAEVNAALKGAMHAGAEDLLVTDGHDHGTNILLEELEPRARLNSGLGTPLGMVEGVQGGVTVAMFIGFHARAGSLNAVLDHTWAGALTNLWLNGRQMGEIGLNAAVCGHYDVPVVMLSGDQTAASEAVDLMSGIETAVVKQARSRMSAECLPLENSQQKVRESAARAISRVRADMGPAPFKIQPPIMVTIELRTASMADPVSMLPGADRMDARRIQFTAEDMPAAYRFVQLAAGLARE